MHYLGIPKKIDLIHYCTFNYKEVSLQNFDNLKCSLMLNKAELGTKFRFKIGKRMFGYKTFH